MVRSDTEGFASTAEELPHAVQDRLARILDDYLVAVEQGAPISPDDLLARHPGDAGHLRGYLSGLKLFHAAAVSPLQPPSAPSAAGAMLPAQTIGDFQLVREIGRGGMGVVYEAMQLSLRRRVALKILPFAATHDARQIGRFKNEAQAAAHVQHPNIVPVFAVGEHEGVHYYAMQLIEGEALAASLQLAGPSSIGTTAPILWSGARCKPTSQVATNSGESMMRVGETIDHVRSLARLGVQAAAALHAAHEYGIVHRDVKPSNLLVDAQGKLWVTDFGLARFRETSGLTQTGDILGTMRYMSPEQALGHAELIDHRTDIYSLGVTLYELATHHHPSGAATDAELLVDRRRFDAGPLRHWNRNIPIEFQTIVLKAIAEFPHERYATAEDFADDLGRFLDGKPILACSPNMLSRTGKWAGRHRGLVAAAAAIFLVAFAGLFASTFLLVREKAASDRAVVAAEENLRQARAVFDRFGTDSDLVDQLAAIPGAEGVRLQLLEDSLDLLQKFERQAADNPKLATDLALAYSKMGNLTEKMGDQRLALDRHVAARTIWAARVAAEPSNEEFVRNLAICHNNIGLLLAEKGQTNEAIAALEQARQLQQSLLAADSSASATQTELGATYGNLGLVLRQIGKRDEAAEKFGEAISIQERLAEETPTREAVLRALAASYNNLGSLDESTDGAVAIDAYRKAIAIERRLVEQQPINRIYQGDFARTYNNLGYVYARRQDWRQARLSYGDAIRIQELLVKASPLAVSYRRDLAISYNNLGMVESHAGRLADAEAALRQAVEVQRLLADAEPADAATLSNLGGVYNNLGMLCERQRRPADAEKRFEQAVGYQRQAHEAAPDMPRYRELLSNHLANYASCLRGQTKLQAADEAARQRDSLVVAGSQAEESAARN